MQNFQTPPPKQVLLRLPDDVAAQLARAVPPRQRNKFFVDLVRRQLAQEDTQLVAACEYMNQLEAANPEFAREGQEWVESVLTKPAQVWDRDLTVLPSSESRNRTGAITTWERAIQNEYAIAAR